MGEGGVEDRGGGNGEGRRDRAMKQGHREGTSSRETERKGRRGEGREKRRNRRMK